MNLITSVKTRVRTWGRSVLPPRMVSVSSWLSYGTGSERLDVYKNIGYEALIDLRAEASHDSLKAMSLGLATHRIPVPDTKGPTSEQITQFLRLIEDSHSNGTRVYVHCSAGRGRAPTMIMAYLVSEGRSTDEALDYLKRLDQRVDPTPAQIQSVRAFEMKIRRFRAI